MGLGGAANGVGEIIADKIFAPIVYVVAIRGKTLAGRKRQRRAFAALISCSCFVLIPAMEPDTLLTYPYVVFRLGCRYCERSGMYRLVRLAAKYGCEAKTEEVMQKLAADCPHWKRNSRWPEGCGVYLPDLEPPRRPPDDPRTKRLRVVK